MSVQDYGRAGEAAAPSSSIWKDFPMGAVAKNPGRYVHIFDDFIGNFTADDVMSVGDMNWVVIGTGIKTAHATDEPNGVVNLSGDSSQNDDAYLCSGMLQEELIKVNSGRRFWFETRLKFVDASVDNTFICGLGEAALQITAALVVEGGNRNNIADFDFIGFHTDNGGTNQDAMETGYHQDGDGGAITAVQAAVRTFGSGTTYDDVYMKLGMRFDGKKTVTFYLDGVALGTTLDIDDLTGNKLDDPLGIIIGVKDLVGSVGDLRIDWVRYGHEKFASGI